MLAINWSGLLAVEHCVMVGRSIEVAHSRSVIGYFSLIVSTRLRMLTAVFWPSPTIVLLEHSIAVAHSRSVIAVSFFYRELMRAVARSR